MNIDISRHRHSHVWSFIRQSERGIVEAIFADFRNFHKTGHFTRSLLNRISFYIAET